MDHADPAADDAAEEPGRWSRAAQDAKALVLAHRSRLTLGLALLLVNRLAGMVLPGTSKLLFDDVIGAGNVGLLVPLAVAGGVATLIQAGTGFALSQILGVAAQRAINDMRIEVQRHVSRLPVSHFDGTQTGVLISRIMSDAEGIRNLVGTGLVQLVGGAITAVLGLAILLWLNVQLTLAVIVALAVFGVVMAVAFKRLRPLFRERGRIRAEVTGRLTQGLGGIRVVKAYTAEPAEQAVFERGVETLFDNLRRTMLGGSGTSAIATAVVGVVGVMLTLMGGRAILADEMSLGDFVMYLAFLGLVVGPVVQVASIGTQITEALAGLDRIREIRRVAREDDGDADRAPCPTVEGEVVFEHVDHAYDEGVPVLHDVSFTAPAGTTTALVGSSGSGKSTLVGLVMAFHRPTAGRVLVDGRDLTDLRLADYRAHLGVVMQENFLFDGTVAENIAFSRPDASREDVEHAGRLAHVDAFVTEFADGYDTVVGERGVKLSGGQRQRVAIARALLADPSLLILDEATSSLDSESEAAIQDALASLRESRTTFVIAHRLSTIRSADQILVIEGGRIVERGRHDELLAADGRYRELHDRQHRLAEERFVNPGEEVDAAPAP